MSEGIIFKFIFWFLLITGAFFELFADYFFKKWSIEGGYLFMFLGFFLYFIGTVFWMSTLKFELLSKSAPIFLILNLIGVVLIGVLIFKENLSFINKIGIMIGLLSIILIEN